MVHFTTRFGELNSGRYSTKDGKRAFTRSVTKDGKEFFSLVVHDKNMFLSNIPEMLASSSAQHQKMKSYFAQAEKHSLQGRSIAGLELHVSSDTGFELELEDKWYDFEYKDAYARDLHIDIIGLKYQDYQTSKVWFCWSEGGELWADTQAFENYESIRNLGLIFTGVHELLHSLNFSHSFEHAGGEKELTFMNG